MPDKADLVLHEGLIAGHRESDSIAITDGRIAAHGRFNRLGALVGPRTHLIKLAGRAVAPGFIDCHLHFLEAASAFAGLQLWRCRTLGDLFAELRVAVGRTPPGNWLRAFGCDEALLKDRRGPARAELDAATPRNPLRLRHQTLHASWLNSRAIAVLGLETPQFTPPPGAFLERDDGGRLTGFVSGFEEWLTSRLPTVTAAEIESRARVFSRELASAGVTAFTDATVRNGVAEAGLFARLVRGGAICQRVTMMLGARHLDSLAEANNAAQDGGVWLVAAKFIEGSASPDSSTVRRAAIALEAGLDCAFHATEVDELEGALRTFELARERARGTAAADARLRIEHGGVIPPDAIARLAALNAWVVTNPGFIHFRGAKYSAEPGLLPHLYRAESLRAANINLAGGTDAPVTPARPLTAIAAAIERRSIDGPPLAPQERLSLAGAMNLFTTSAAALTGLEAGEIEIGKLADLVVLPDDPHRLTPSELMNLHVDLTIVGGKIIYERGRPAIANSDFADLRSP